MLHSCSYTQSTYWIGEHNVRDTHTAILTLKDSFRITKARPGHMARPPASPSPLHSSTAGPSVTTGRILLLAAHSVRALFELWSTQPDRGPYRTDEISQLFGSTVSQIPIGGRSKEPVSSASALGLFYSPLAGNSLFQGAPRPRHWLARYGANGAVTQRASFQRLSPREHHYRDAEVAG